MTLLFIETGMCQENGAYLDTAARAVLPTKKRANLLR